MPEIVTKYPLVILKELEDAGGKCGQGIKPQILVTCPKDKFCVLPTGEICIYDLSRLSTMTQISHSEWSEAIRGVPDMLSLANCTILIFIFGIGLALGMMLNKRK